MKTLEVNLPPHKRRVECPDCEELMPKAHFFIHGRSGPRSGPGLIDLAIVYECPCGVSLYYMELVEGAR